MKASRLIAEIASQIKDHGDFIIVMSQDAEGNGPPNEPRGVDVVYINRDDPECIYDHECEAQADCDNYEAVMLIWV